MDNFRCECSESMKMKQCNVMKLTQSIRKGYENRKFKEKLSNSQRKKLLKGSGLGINNK